jgi:hypothetical protein
MKHPFIPPSSSSSVPADEEFEDNNSHEDTTEGLSLRVNRHNAQIEVQVLHGRDRRLPSIVDGTLTRVTFVIDFHQEYFEIQYNGKTNPFPASASNLAMELHFLLMM